MPIIVLNYQFQKTLPVEEKVGNKPHSEPKGVCDEGLRSYWK